MDRQAHWDRVYAEKRPEQVSWFQAEARLSLELITEHAPSRASAIADIGGGASRLVDGLLARGYRAVTVLDLSAAALDAARARLAASGTPGASGATTAVEAPGATAAAGRVRWIADDVLTHGFDAASIDVWHDRAVFHFLTDPADRARYVEQVRHAVRPGGLVLVATFAEDGPARCSGLEVVRYSPDALHAQFGEAFRVMESRREEHRTPTGTVQWFTYCACRYEPAPTAQRAA